VALMLRKRRLSQFMEAMTPLEVPSDFFTDGQKLRLGAPIIREYFPVISMAGTAVGPLALALAKTDMWEGHAGQTQANPFGFGIHSDSITCLHVTVLSGIPGICRADCYMHAVHAI
jgi:hypothetical protein